MQIKNYEEQRKSTQIFTNNLYLPFMLGNLQYTSFLSVYDLFFQSNIHMTKHLGVIYFVVNNVKLFNWNHQHIFITISTVESFGTSTGLYCCECKKNYISRITRQRMWQFFSLSVPIYFPIFVETAWPTLPPVSSYILAMECS